MVEDNIDIQDLRDVVKEKIKHYNLSKYFEIIKDFSYNENNSSVKIDSSNSLLIAFPTLKSEFPEIYPSEYYRLLFILSLYNEKEFKHELINELIKLRGKENIDMILVWSMENIKAQTLQALKNQGIYVIQPDDKYDKYLAEENIIPNFVKLKKKNIDYNYLIKINTIAEYIIKRLKKLFHLILSEIAAPIYDKYYAKSKVATKSYMNFEEKILRRLIERLKNENKNNIAIDVGCGTGRLSFILSKNFKTVYAFDFSQKMIEEAKNRKRIMDVRNIIFSVNDFEYEELPEEKEFFGKCNLVVASFGMGSFIEDTPKMLRRFYEWLKPGGYVFLSFYNKNSIVNTLTPNWRDVSLSARLDFESKTLTVELTPSIKYTIYCKPYDKNIESLIKGTFVVDSIFTYPTLMALLPNSLLEEDSTGIFEHIDSILSKDENFRFGYYITIIAHKPLNTIKGYSNIMKILERNNVEYKVLEHKPVYTIEDVKREIGYFPNCMIKTIIFKIKTKGHKFIAVILPSEKRIDKERIANALKISKSKIKFAPEKDIIKLGFPLGGIAPFGFEECYDIVKFVDEDILTSKCKWLYMGVGDNRKTLKINKDDFLKLISDYRKIIL